MTLYEALLISICSLGLTTLALVVLLWWLHRQTMRDIQPPAKPRSVEEIARMQ